MTAQTRDTARPQEPAVCPGDSDDELLSAWFRLYAGMQNLTADLLAEVEHSGGLTPPEFQVIWHLHRSPERRAPMNEISRLLNFSTAGTTKLIDRLCAMDLVARQTSPADRRVILAEITEAGERAAAAAEAVFAAALRERFLGKLGGERTTALFEAFEILGARSGPC